MRERWIAASQDLVAPELDADLLLEWVLDVNLGEHADPSAFSASGIRASASLHPLVSSFVISNSAIGRSSSPSESLDGESTGSLCRISHVNPIHSIF